MNSGFSSHRSGSDQFPLPLRVAAGGCTDWLRRIAYVYFFWGGRPFLTFGLGRLVDVRLPNQVGICRGVGLPDLSYTHPDRKAQIGGPRHPTFMAGSRSHAEPVGTGASQTARPSGFTPWSMTRALSMRPYWKFWAWRPMESDGICGCRRMERNGRRRLVPKRVRKGMNG